MSAPVFRTFVGRTVALGILAALVLQVGSAAAFAAPAGHAPTASPGSNAPPGPTAAPTSEPAPTASVSTEVSGIESMLKDRGVPAGAIHLPDLAGATPGRSGPVQPLYTTGPAPMGISDLGLRNVSGTLTPYTYSTSSVWGSVGLTKAEAVYVDGDGPDTFGIQLNAVATNVTLLGKDGYEFWTQDFVSYTTSTGNLSFGDNVWNFSSSAYAMTKNVFASHGPNGTLVSPVFYYALGPSFTVAYPFTLNLFLNASKVSGRPAVFFNYSVTATNGSWHGSFDYVAFNSQPSRGVGSAGAPAFQVNGSGVDPAGLPNDFEIVLVGTGDGDTTTFFSMNATVSLEVWNATAAAYAVVPAAYDAGSDTGETSNGILPVYHTPLLGGAPTVTLGPGPSFVEGLWNVSTALDGARSFTLTQKPQNAFLFVSPGTSLNASLAQWVPTIRLGASTTTLSIPNSGAFEMEWMLSDRTPITYGVSAVSPLPNSTTSLPVNLTVSAAAGSYTPLLAWGNAEVGAVSQSGAGTAASPYVLIHRPVGGLNPVFAQLNDFGFPVFAAVLLVSTTDYVHVTEVPAGVTYGNGTNTTRAREGLPASNSLQLEFWNVSNVVVTNSTALTGWLTASLWPFPGGELLFWDSSGNLVASNTFYDQGVAIALYGGKGNTVWGNTFLSGATLPTLYYGTNTTGLLEWESGDLIYNNFFAVDQGALTPTADAASCLSVCVPTTYTDTWNVTREAASAKATVLGAVLTGSILGTSYQGGNYWSNYGTASDPFGVLPYDDGGLITVGGDYVPLYPSALYPVSFVETGLSGGLAWSETTLGVIAATTATTIVVSLPNGTYPYTVVTPAGYVGPGPSDVVVNGTAVTVPVPFSELFTQSVHVSGLVSGWSWSVAFTAGAGSGGRDASLTSTAAAGSVGLLNGTYTYAVSAYGYTATPSSGAFIVSGPVAPISVTFQLVAVLTVTAVGLPSGVPWTVTVTQGATIVTDSAIGNGSIVFTVLELNPGPFTWTVRAANYTVTPASGSGTAPSTTSAPVVFAAIPPSPGPAPPFDWTAVAVGVLAALAVAGFVLFAWERHRRRPPAQPLVPAAAPVPAPGSEPWVESDTDAERPHPYSRAK